MARFTDNAGKLLGGIEMPLAQMLVPLPEQAVADSAPSAVAGGGEYAPNEVISALQCYYGLLNYSASPDLKHFEKVRRPMPRCPAAIEEPEERHHCAHCQGFYCLVHAEPLAHACASRAQ